MSPYQTEHINPSGNYSLDIERLPEPTNFEFRRPLQEETVPGRWRIKKMKFQSLIILASIVVLMAPTSQNNIIGGAYNLSTGNPGGTGTAGGGNTVNVPAGASLQNYVNNAQPGDTLVLKAGATYAGPITLSNTSNSTNYITIRSSALSSLPGAGYRVGPRNAVNMPKITAPNNGVAIQTAASANHYILLGLEITPVNASAVVYDLVTLGNNSTQKSTAASPHDITVDRCYVHGIPNVNIRTGIGLNGMNINVINSHLSDIHSDSYDAHALGGVNGAGPFNIENNYLESSTENILFGGATAATVGLVPSHITVKHNYFYKPLTWKNWSKVSMSVYNATPTSQRAKRADGTYAVPFIITTPGVYTAWVKNHFELKNAQDVLLDSNVIDNNWVQADQAGNAVLLTPRTQQCAQTWATVQRVTITNNIIHNVGGFTQMSGIDATCQTGPRTNSITVQNNIIDGVLNSLAYDISRIIQPMSVAGGVFNHNDILHNSDSATYGNDYFFWGAKLAYDPALNTGIQYMCNISQYAGGLSGASNMTSPVFGQNVLIGVTRGNVPGTNFYAASVSNVGFTNYAAGSYALTASSPYKNVCSDGTDPGANIAQVTAATATVIAGTP